MRNALHLVLAGDLSGAELALAEAAKVDSSSADVYMALANLYRARGEVGRAIQIHQNVLLRPDLGEEVRLEALLARAEQQEDRPDADAAQRILSMVFVQASFYQPTELLKDGKPGAALAMLRIAAAIRPRHPRVCLQQSRTYAQLSRNKEALESLRCALESGMVPPELVEGDAYLAPLRSDPAYRKILEETGAAADG